MKIYNINSKKLPLLEVYDGAAIFIGAYITQIFLQFAFSLMLALTGVDISFTKTMVGICMLASINQIALLATPFLFSKIRSVNLVKDCGYNRGFSPIQGILFVLIAVSTIVAFAPIANYFVSFIEDTGYNMSGIATLEIKTVGQMIAGLIFMCVLPAVCEELIYRGMLVRAFGDKGIIFAIIMSSLFFSIMHGSPVQLIHQFFLGGVCAIVYVMTRSLWSAVVVHFVNNSIAIVGNYINNVTGKTQLALPLYINIIMIVGGLIVLVGLLFLLYKISYERKKKEDTQPLASNSTLQQKLAYLFATQQEKECYAFDQQLLNEQLEQCETSEAKEILLATKSEEKSKMAKRNRMAVIFALVIGLAVWILNTVVGYLT